MVLKFLDKEGE